MTATVDIMAILLGFFSTIALLGVGIIAYYLKATINELKETRKQSDDNKIDLIRLSNRIEIAETNHNHLANTNVELNSTMKDLVVAVNGLQIEMVKKKNL